jgi:protease-4
MDYRPNMDTESNVPPEMNPPAPPSPPPVTPPPFLRPPPMVPPPPPPAFPSRAPNRGSGWKAFAIIILVILLGFSLLLNFSQALRRAVRGGVSNYSGNAAPKLEEVTIRESTSTNKIAVIPVEGIISGDAEQGGEYNMVTLIKDQLKRAKADPQVRAVILKVNSPGGEVLASDEIANAIRSFQKKSEKPVVVSMGSLAASGGYYISAPSTYIVANELTITGSIGVIMHGLNYRGLLDKIGVRPEVFKSGKYKDMMSGTKSQEEITPEERQMVQDLIDETFGKFKRVVGDGRKAAYQLNGKSGTPLSADWESYADGRILSGNEALKLGLVDAIGDFDSAVDHTKTLVKIDNAELVEYQPMFELSNLFKLLGKSDAKAVKVEIGLDVPKLHAGYLYFLSPTFLN